MYVVTVQFIVKDEAAEAFRARVLRQAADSLERESGCSVFDVCADPDRGDRIFLYEVYDDRAAFESHLQSDHFKAFDADSAEMIASKTVEIFVRVS